MVSSNTESGITVTYEDSDGTLDFSVASQTDENFTTTLKNKLDGIETGATADQTAAEIRTLVGSASDSNVFTDADHTKLDGIETGATADQTAAEIRTLVGSASDSNVFTDADHTKLDGIETGATADQTKSDIDALGIDADQLDSQEGSYYLNYNNFSNTPTIPTNNNQLTNGAGYVTANTQLSNEQVQDIVGGMVSSNTESGITVTYEDSDGTLDFSVASQTDENFTTTLKNKLDGIEASADVTDATNVNAAGAVMNSDTGTGSMSFVVDEDDMSSNSATKVPTQQSVKTYVDTEVASVIDSAPGALNTLNELAAALGDDASFSTTVTNSIATKLPLAGGTMTGNIVMSGSETVDGRDLSADGTKLDGIEASATADQTAAEILTAIKTVDGTTSGLDADLLDSQEGSYYTNASNLGSGTVPDARFPATLPAVSGASLTSLTGASADTYGDESNVAQIVVDANGRITGITEVSILPSSAVYIKCPLVSVNTLNDLTSYTNRSVINTSSSFDSGSFTIESDGITVPTAGIYSCSFTCYMTSSVQRANVGVKFTINGTEQSEIAAMGYIRDQWGHEETSLAMTTLYNLSANDKVNIIFARLANSGTVTLETNSSINLHKL